MSCGHEQEAELNTSGEAKKQCRGKLNDVLVLRLYCGEEAVLMVGVNDGWS